MIPEPQHNHEAETGALGVCLIAPDDMARASIWLTPEMFYQQRHATIWRAILAVFHRGELVNSKTVFFELKKTGDYETVGGIDYLSDLTDRAIPGQIETYAAEVERCAILRSVFTAGAAIQQLGIRETDAELAIGSAQKAVADIAMRRIGSGLLSSGAAADLEYQRLQRANDGLPPACGVMTGFRDLDELLLGLNDSDVIIVAARPSVGKTAFLLSLAHGVADKAPDRDCLIFSLEMSEEQLRYRRLSMLSGIDSMRVRTLRLSEADQGAYMRALDHLASMPIFVDDTAAVSASAIRSACHRHQAQHGRPLVIFVDYLQLMTVPSERIENRVQVVSEISRSLKALAKELHCPVVALSQLSRAPEHRTSHVPILSDLRESGGIEQDSDVVLMLHRPELYDKEDADHYGIAEVHIAKHRNGPIGVVPMRFDKSTTTFQTLTYRSPDGYEARHVNND